MTETEQTPAAAAAENRPENEAPEDPGMLETVGSFPVWMLKLIDQVTPDLLRTKEPPKKNYRI